MNSNKYNQKRKMPRQTCTVCEDRKSVDEFPKDSRKVSGYDSICKSCRNASARTKVKCPNCNQSCSRAGLGAHMETKSCVEGKTEWKHPMQESKQFKSNSRSIVKCPCGHRKCKGKVKECVAYRHMRWGIGHKFRSHISTPDKEKAPWKHPMRKSKQFKSNSRAIVNCPCGHKLCKVEIKEFVAFKHMRYGIGHKFKSQISIPVKEKAPWKHPMRKSKQFKSNSRAIVKCPCGHRLCKGVIKEFTAFRHMRYGLEFLMKPRVTYRLNERNDSDSERDM